MDECERFRIALLDIRDTEWGNVEDAYSDMRKWAAEALDPPRSADPGVLSGEVVVDG